MIGSPVIEAIIEFRVGDDDESVIGERAAHEFLDLRRGEGDLLLGVERFIGKDLYRADVGVLAVVRAACARRLPVHAVGGGVPGGLGLIECPFQAVDADRTGVARKVRRGSQGQGGGGDGCIGWNG